MTRQPFWPRELSARFLDLQRELGQILSRVQNAATQGSPQPGADPTELDPSSWDPAVDLVEDPGQVRLWVDLPGVDASSIDLTVAGNVLTLRGQRVMQSDLVTGRPHLLERPYGPFVRQVYLPCEVDVDHVEAHAKDGVLQVTLPKAEVLRPRNIPIQPVG